MPCWCNSCDCLHSQVCGISPSGKDDAKRSNPVCTMINLAEKNSFLRLGPLAIRLHKNGLETALLGPRRRFPGKSGSERQFHLSTAFCFLQIASMHFVGFLPARATEALLQFSGSDVQNKTLFWPRQDIPRRGSVRQCLAD